MSVSTRSYAIAAASVAVIGLVAIYAITVGDTGDRFAPCRASTVGGGTVGGPFTLTDENGSRVTDKDVLTGPSLVYFGYTF